MPKAIIVGATSGIGEALAELLSPAGYTLGLTGRRQDRLLDLQTRLPNKTLIQTMDVKKHEQAIPQLKQLIQDLGGLDLLILSAGISHRMASWEQEQDILLTNVTGFAALARAGYDYFLQARGGHLVGISSISALRGRGENVAYAASKAFESNYLQGLRQKAARRGVDMTVTEILAGWVDTPLIRGSQGKRFWVAPVNQAARQIVQAIRKKKSHVYVTRRWWLIAWFLKMIPDGWHKRM